MNLFKTSFPASIDYIPAMREFVAGVLLSYDYNDKFAYRSEIIVDELCCNAVKFGSLREVSRIELILKISEAHVSLSVLDEGGGQEDISELERVIATPVSESDNTPKLGLEIVKMLAETVTVSADEDSTRVGVIRVKENKYV
jgi:anti-sigma regulatory factor (Ser/Thr protein kinase)